MLRHPLFLSWVWVLTGCSTTMCSDIEPHTLPEAGEQVSWLSVPEGFEVRVYASGLENARSLVLGDGGTLFVSTRKLDRVYAVRDEDGDGHGERVQVVLSGLHVPNGLEFRDGALYVAEQSRILRYDDIESRLDDPPEPVVLNDTFPTDASHGWKVLRFSPDGEWLYVPVGAPCNVCKREDERYASILRMRPDGSELEVFAHGVRNSVGMDFEPSTGVLWFTDNGRDHLGDNRPPDELNRAPEAGLHFGFPHCHGGDIEDPEHAKPCADFTPPVQKLGPHVAALGMRFYTGAMFPEAYHEQIFIAEHGSWNRSSKIGYQVSLIRRAGDRALSYEPFVTGWLEEETVSGRPVDVLVMPDGALLVSDDHAGVVYRVSYNDDP